MEHLLKLDQSQVGLIAQLLVFATLIFTVLRFIKEKKREFQKRFFEEQLKIFSEMLDYSSKVLIYDKKDSEYTDAVKNFKRLYWGKMCLVENKDVERKMCKFDTLLDQYNDSKTAASDLILKKELKEAQLELSHTCRNSCRSTWEIDKNIKGFNDYSTGIK